MRGRSTSTVLFLTIFAAACATTSTEGSIRETRELAAPRLSLDKADADRAAELALQNNRALRVEMEELGVVQARRARAYSLPNPELSGTAQFPTSSEHTGVKLEGALSIDLLGLLLVPAKAAAANRALEAAKYRLAHRMVTTALDAKIAFYRAQAAEQLIAVESAAVETHRLAKDFATRQHEAGTINELELAEETVAFQEAHLELGELELQREETRAALARAIGADDLTTAFAKFPPLPPLPNKELDLTKIEQRRLDLLAAASEKEAAEQESSVASYQRLPSLHAGVAAEREADDGHTMIGPEVELEIPLFDLNRGEIAEREAEARARAAEVSLLEEKITRQITLAKKRLLAARTGVEHWEKEGLPIRAQAVEAAQRHYNLGALGVYDLLRAKKREVEARKKRIEALRDYWIARAELERAAGTSLGGSPPPVTAPQEEPQKPQEHHHHHHGGQ